MARFFWAFAPSAAFFKLFFTLWMVSYASVPNLGVNIDPVPDALATISEGEDGGQFDFSSRFENGNGAVAFFAFLALTVGTVLNKNRAALASVFNRFAPVRVFADEEEVSSVPDISIALSDGILKGLPSYAIGVNPEYNEVVPASATLSAGGANQPRPPEWEEVMRGISAEEEERMRLEMKKMTATFTEEAAGEYSEDMRAMFGKNQKKKRAAGASRRGTRGGFVFRAAINRKNSVVTALAWGDEGDDDEGGGDAGVETTEEKAERRRRKKEKKERRNAGGGRRTTKDRRSSRREHINYFRDFFDIDRRALVVCRTSRRADSPGDSGAGVSPARAAMDRDANVRFDDAFEVGERIGAGGLGTVHACRARGDVNAKIPRGMPLVVKTVRVRLDAGGCVRANVPTSGRVDAEIRALRRLDACAERDSNATSAMFPSLVAAFSGQHVEKRSPEDATRNVPSSAARVVMTNPAGASSCDLLRLRAEARERRGDENAQFPESRLGSTPRRLSSRCGAAARARDSRTASVKPSVLVRRGTASSRCATSTSREVSPPKSHQVSRERGCAWRRGHKRRGNRVWRRRKRNRVAFGVVGTPEYVAPEAARARRGATAQADWYQLGVFAFELVFGRTPFAAPFGVVGMTLRLVEANDLRFFDALFASAAATTSDADARERTRGRDDARAKKFAFNQKTKRNVDGVVPFLRFTRGLLEGDPESRLGDADVRRAEFFACVDWEALKRGAREIGASRPEREGRARTGSFF